MFSGSMLIMRLVLGNLLLLLALGPCFKSTDAQETTTKTDENTTNPLPNNDTVESTLSSEITSATPENTVTLLQTEADPHNPETTLVNEINTMLEEPTGESTPPLSIEQTSPESVPETTTVQTEQTTVTTPTLPVNVETTVIEQITSDAPSTSQYETTVGFTSPESTSSTECPTDEITTAAVAMTTDSTEALNPTSILTTPPADWTESPSIMSDPVDTSTETSTSTSTTSTSTTQLPQNTADYPYSRSDEESASTHFTTATTGVIIGGKIMSWKTSWLLIIIVFVAIIFALCVGMILFTQQRKKNASRNFSPMYMNGQSKRSKKKKGAEDDAWAGPVKLEAGVECDAEEGLMPNNGKQDGDDMVLRTFAALDAADASNGGVGGDGTKEAKKWEEQEPLLYTDEDVNEGKTGKTLEESEKRNGDEKSEEKVMNGGETFCLTTAV
ncbi:cell wall protein DAN4-like [Sinocyclocheilus rhinocerous]|uniref:cell wall protein DAN4-like n=1 Tax=Sinocyclocheilus rhinocerous TaxID=307959 RepID=UPI0007B83EBF|nr:PREDICTED: cell wall protein DAN4-like [Sinocyclocheilus rhinocerous]